jgi:acetylserotonin N-methyltransferase
MANREESASKRADASARQNHAEQIMGLATGYAASQILFNSDELGLFDKLKDGGRTLEWLSQETGIKPAPLERLLIGCCSLQLLRRLGGTFELGEVARRCLLKNEPGYVGGLFSFFKRGLYPLWEHLETALREQRPQWDRVPGIGQGGPFEALYREEASLREFQDAMFQLSYPTGLAACEAIDFSGFRSAVDIGGGTGGFVIALCQRVPQLRASIFDLPPVEKAAAETIARHGLDGRITFLRGDFFSDALPSADLYVLGDILHDWGTEDGTRLLEKVYAALPSRGAVCIVENLLNENRDGPPLSAVINLTMLVATYGEQRTPAEFAEWLGSIGFERFEHHDLPAPRGIFVGWKG